MLKLLNNLTVCLTLCLQQHYTLTFPSTGSSALIIDSCNRLRDALTYKAVASNSAGETETAAPLTIQSSTKPDEPESRPIFLHKLKDVVVDEGQQLVLEAPFTGNPIPSVDWTKDGVPIEASDRILMTCDGRRVGLSLVLTNKCSKKKRFCRKIYRFMYGKQQSIRIFGSCSRIFVNEKIALCGFIYIILTGNLLIKVGLKVDKAVPSDAGVYGVTITNPLGQESTDGKATVRKIFQPPAFTQRFTDLQQVSTQTKS